MESNMLTNFSTIPWKKILLKDNFAIPQEEQILLTDLMGRYVLRKSIFLKENANLVNQLPSVFKKYNNTTHHGIEMTPPIETSKKINKNRVYFNHQDKKET